MSELERPADLAYHAGPWPTAMRVREARDAERRPTGRAMFFGAFLWWESVEAQGRGAMVAGAPWGCAVA